MQRPLFSLQLGKGSGDPMSPFAKFDRSWASLLALGPRSSSAGGQATQETNTARSSKTLSQASRAGGAHKKLTSCTTQSEKPIGSSPFQASWFFLKSLL
eukprot:3693761-Amphidinium_carterae.1